MQAIQTKVLPATNTLGTRIKATCERGSFTIPYPDGKDLGDAHHVAARYLTTQFANEDSKHYGTNLSRNPWLRPFVTGQLPDGSYAHVFTS